MESYLGTPHLLKRAPFSGLNLSKKDVITHYVQIIESNLLLLSLILLIQNR